MPRCRAGSRQVQRPTLGPAPDFLRLIRKRAPALSLTEVRQSLGRATLALDYRAAQPVQTMLSGQTAPAQPAAGTAVASPKPPASRDKTPWRHVTLRDLISSGTVRLPLDIETTYKGHQLTARIEADGNVTWNGAKYDSLSMAGGIARKSIVGAPPGRDYPPTNGWTFWRFRDADGRLAFVDALRQRYLAR